MCQSWIREITLRQGVEVRGSVEALAASAAPNRVQGESLNTRSRGSCASRSDLRLTWPAFYTAGVTFGLCLISPLGASAGGRHSRTTQTPTLPSKATDNSLRNPAKILSPHPSKLVGFGF